MIESSKIADEKTAILTQIQKDIDLIQENLLQQHSDKQWGKFFMGFSAGITTIFLIIGVIGALTGFK